MTNTTPSYPRPGLASSRRSQAGRRRWPLEGYTEDQLRFGTTHGLALDPLFVSIMNLRRLQREGIRLALHPCPVRLFYHSDSGACYTVGEGVCNCPAGDRRRVCRHQIGVQRAGLPGGFGLLRAALLGLATDGRRAA